MASPTAEPPPIVGAPRWGDDLLIVLSFLTGLSTLGLVTFAYLCFPEPVGIAVVAGRVVSLFSPFAYYPYVLIVALLPIGAMWTRFLWHRFGTTADSSGDAERSKGPVAFAVLMAATAVVLGSWLLVLSSTIIRWLWGIPAMFGG